MSIFRKLKIGIVRFLNDRRANELGELQQLSREIKRADDFKAEIQTMIKLLKE